MSEDDVFRTARLSVRKWRASDEPLLLAIYKMPLVAKYVDDGTPLSPDEAALWMEKTRRNYETRGYGMFAIEHLNTAGPIGFGGLVHPGGQTDAEVKYAFTPDVWGEGLATEFVKGLLIYGQRAHGLTSVIATVADENGASKRVLEKAGLTETHKTSEDDGSRIAVFSVTF